MLSFDVFIALQSSLSKDIRSLAWLIRIYICVSGLRDFFIDFFLWFNLIQFCFYSFVVCGQFHFGLLVINFVTIFTKIYCVFLPVRVLPFYTLTLLRLARWQLFVNVLPLVSYRQQRTVCMKSLHATDLFFLGIFFRCGCRKAFAVCFWVCVFWRWVSCCWLFVLAFIPVPGSGKNRVRESNQTEESFSWELAKFCCSWAPAKDMNECVSTFTFESIGILKL